MIRLKYTALLLLSSAFFFSCSSEPGPLEEPDVVVEPNKPTPYQLVIPNNLPKTFTIPENNPLTVEGVELGRHLFYERKLSGDNTMSCSTCHQQQLAFTDGKAVSFGIARRPTKRGAMSLANMLWFNRFNWDGEANSLEQQALIPLESELEMHQSLSDGVKKLQETGLYPPMFQKAFGSSTITEENVLKALGQFQRTLISGNSRYDQYLENKINLTPDEMEGMALFMTHPEPAQNLRGGNCGDCHGGTLLTTRTFHNNGLDVELKDNGLGAITGRATDNGKFKAPSLRNIALTAPYMHDGRFETLEQVLDHYNELHLFNNPNLDPLIMEASNMTNGRTLKLTEEEKQKIIKFLHTLTDESFITDPRFSDPFKQ
ncbi:cytochrome-c peroxidase [Pontibacter sp. SGAir0037]|uniref:cytochrome-c peroxidase n=1 Tax=Pontibacter sp. SGAir0037 TaxID=2571030 RepID=UPI0010CD45EF|nr:cytochrome c peroxidase [Pontibacter sp. SGAir0037]QCR23261.1 cytochrome-c peroxidase [Pontibacter sp. SGAir0037]